MAFPVKHFTSDMGGAPVLGDTAAGDFIGLLKACLVTGFNVTPVGTMTYDGGTGEVSVDVGTSHGFKRWQVVEISGADQAAYNGEHRVAAITNSTFSFVPGSAPAVSPATGATIEAKAAPVGGWEVVMEDATNHHLALRSTAPDATDHTFMITNDGYQGSQTYQEGNYARVRILESFTDFSTYEEATGQWWPASHRHAWTEWMLVADDKTIFWVDRYAGYSSYGKRRSAFVLGDIESVRPGDAAHCVVNGIEDSSSGEWDSSDNPYSDFANLGSSSYRSIARAYHQLPGAAGWSLLGIGSVIGGEFDYPNPQTNAFYVATGKVMVKESGGLRGYMPGLLQPMQTSGVYHKAIIDNLPGLEGVPVLFWLASSSRSMVDGEDRLIAFRLDLWRQEAA